MKTWYSIFTNVKDRYQIIDFSLYKVLVYSLHSGVIFLSNPWYRTPPLVDHIVISLKKRRLSPAVSPIPGLMRTEVTSDWMTLSLCLSLSLAREEREREKRERLIIPPPLKKTTTTKKQHTIKKYASYRCAGRTMMPPL